LRRLYLSIIFTVISSLIVMGWALDKVFEASSTPEPDGEFSYYFQLAQGLQRQLSHQSDLGLAEQVALLAEDFKLKLTLEHKSNLALPAELLSALDSGRGVVLDSETGPYILQPLMESEYSLQLFIPQQPERGSRALELVLTMALYLGLCTVLILWLLPLTRRLSLLNKTADRFGLGELDARVPSSQFSYISTLEASFNRMANQVNELVTENKLLADSLSHDLRTPLACLRFGIDAALDAQDPQKKQNYLLRIEDEVERMEQMIEAFLEYAKIERQGLQLNRQAVKIYPLLLGIVNELQPLAEKQQRKITNLCQISELEITADRHWLYRLLLNLLTNAIHYSKQDIYINFQQLQGKLLITVEDDGDGIPEDKQQEVFKPFTRLEKSRNRNIEGFGLGLAMVSRIADWHHGQISVTGSAALGGACFKLSLPLNP